MTTRLVVIVFCFFTHWGTANAAPTLAEAEQALVKIVCGDAHCSPPITLSNSISPSIRYGGFPKEHAKLVGAVFEIICSHMDKDERLSGVCNFSREASVGISPDVRRNSACIIDTSFPMRPRPLAIHPQANFAEIQSCIIWAGLSNVLTDGGASLHYCSKDELGLLEALVATNGEFQKVVFSFEELSDTNRLVLNNAFLTQAQKDKREISNRLEKCPNLKEEEI